MAALAVVKGLKEKRTGAKSDQATLIFIYSVLLSKSHILNFPIRFFTSHHPDTISSTLSNHLDYSDTSI